MKKILLTAAVAVSAMAANAQALQPMSQMVKADKSLTAAPQAMASSRMNAPKKAVVDGCYYTRPEGSYAYGFGKDGRGYYNAYVVVPPYTPFEFVNKSTAVSSWLWVGDADIAAENVTEDNNFAWEQYGASGYYLPTISTGRVEYTWGQTDNTYGDNYPSLMRTEDVISPLTTTDPHMGPDYIGWGFLSSHFLFGDGQLANGGNTYQCYAVEQSFPKPLSPLYVEDIFIDLLTLDKEVFLADGEELTLDILNVDGEVLYTLTAGANDLIIDDDTPSSTTYGNMRFAKAVFTMKSVDPITGILVSKPFVLNEAYIVRISGFEGKGIGFRGHFMMDDNNNPTAEATIVENGYLNFYNVADESDKVSYTFQNPIAIPINFSAMFDKAQVWTSANANGDKLEDFNVIKISADGQTVQYAGYPDFNFVCVNTASSWYNNSGSTNYRLADANGVYPNWLNTTIDNSGWTDSESIDPTVYISFKANALPNGVSGRGVKLYVYGRGVKSEEPIYILQGNCTKEDLDGTTTGINSVSTQNTTNDQTYNITGQHVNDNFKGIIIKNGKKVVNK